MIRCPECNTPLDIRRKPDGGKTEPVSIEAILALRKFGATNTEIAQAYQVSRQRIDYIVRKHT